MKWMFPGIVLVLFSCAGESDDFTTDPIDQQNPKREKITICREVDGFWDSSCHEELLNTAPPDTSTFDTKIELFHHAHNSSYHACNIYKKDGKTVLKVGDQWREAPFENWEIPMSLIKMGDTLDVHETFDSLMCEVGGNSAYDKHVFTKDSEGRVIQIDHYMAWFESYDEDENGEEIYIRDYTPDWFLGRRMDITYEPMKTTYKVFWEGAKWEETITNTYDNQGRLAKQERLTKDDRYVAFYYYFDNYRFNIQAE